MMRKDLKVALVTGSTKGIGLITALQLVKTGYIVIINSRKKINMLSAAFVKYIDINTRVDYIAGDVTDEDDVRRIFNVIYEKYGRIDVLVNNVGYSFERALIRVGHNEMLSMPRQKLRWKRSCFAGMSLEGELGYRR